MSMGNGVHGGVFDGVEISTVQPGFKRTKKNSFSTPLGRELFILENSIREFILDSTYFVFRPGYTVYITVYIGESLIFLYKKTHKKGRSLEKLQF